MPKRKTPKSRWREFDDLRTLLLGLARIDNANYFLEKIPKLIKLAAKLSESKFGGRPDFLHWLEKLLIE